MPPAKGKRHSATTASRVAAVKRSKKGPAAKEDNFFLHSDDEETKQRRAARGSASQASDALDQAAADEVHETAEEKRLRLAREYLEQLRAHAEDDLDERRGVTGGSGGEAESDDNGDKPGPSGRERLSTLLRLDAAQSAGRLQRHIAAALVLPSYDDPRAAGTARRGHHQSPTSLTLSHDDTTAWTVAKDGSICRWDVETGAKRQLPKPGAAASKRSGPEWVKPAARLSSREALHAVAVSSDGALLAVGGADKAVHVYDARAGTYIQAFPGHRDGITALAFREGSHTLFSASMDRTVKLWSLDDRAYMDTLFGHQAEVLALDVGRAERAVTGGADRTCRVWKIPEESQLIFKHASPGAAQTIECCRYITGTDWISGASDGSLQLWTQLKRKPVAVVRGAHGPSVIALHGAALAGAVMEASPLATAEQAPDVTGWVQSVAAARGTDVVASGAGDGAIRLWRLTSGKAGGLSGLQPLGSLPARGWVNGLAIARSARFVVAALGQEPRLGRWARDSGARNGLLIHRLAVGEAVNG